MEKQITDDMLKRLGGLKDLESLDVRNGRITDEGFAHLQGLTRLKTLNREWTKVTGSGLAHLKSANNLTELHVRWTDIDDAGLGNVQHFPNLEILTLGPPEQKSKITDAGLKHVASLRKLRVLRIHGFRHSLSLTGRVRAVERLEELEELVQRKGAYRSSVTNHRPPEDCPLRHRISEIR